MKALWSWVDKAHRTRLEPRKWNRLRIESGTVDHEAGILAEAQLYFDVSPGVVGISIRFVRVYDDGRTDATGYQDFHRLPKATLNVSPQWSGQMDPSYRLVIEERHERGIVTQGNTIYKGWE